MMHKAWCSIKEVPCYFSGSSIKFQGHTGWKIDNLNPIWVRLLGRSQLSNLSDLPCSFTEFWQGDSEDQSTCVKTSVRLFSSWASTIINLLYTYLWVHFIQNEWHFATKRDEVLWQIWLYEIRAWGYITVKIPKCGCMEHGLKCITFYV